MSDDDSTVSERANLVAISRQIQFQTAPQDNQRFETKEQKRRCRSASKELVKILSNLKCKSCGKSFSSTNPPRLALCGHYFCADHEKEKRFKCPKCEDTREMEFLSDQVLDDFYKAIEKPGYPCQPCKGNQFHPRENVVFSPSRKTFWCVWCVLEKSPHGSTFDFQTDFDIGEMTNRGDRLNSVDRTQNPSGWALNMCCFCWDTLHKVGEDRTQIVHLPCNHIGHRKCEEKDEIKKGDKVTCGWCSEEYEKEEDVKMISARTKDYGLSEDSEYEVCIAIAGRCCLQSHPKSNLNENDPMVRMNRCVWCELENKCEKKSVSCSSM